MNTLKILNVFHIQVNEITLGKTDIIIPLQVKVQTNN